MENKIMIVDDAAFMRMVIKDTLKKSGYENLIEAPDGERAVELYKLEKPNLVFMDITMPNKDGLQALKEIKAFDPEAKVVMCSAMGQQTIVLEAIQVGAKDFIVKPFKGERILKTVNNILGA